MSVSPVGAAGVGLDPFDRDDFQAGLVELADTARRSWQQWTADSVLIAELAGQVPGSSDDWAWKSFVREVAVARRCSDRAAGKQILLAVALTRSHPRTLALLQAGTLPAWHAQVLIEECLGLPPAVIAEVEQTVADRAGRLGPARIRDAIRRIELRHDADAAAVRAATATAARGVRLDPQPDGQASLTISGPAQPVVAFYAALTAAARAAKAAGDTRGLDALRFDLALDLADPGTDTPPTAPSPTAPSPTAPSPTAESPRGEAPGAPVWLGDRRRVRPVQLLIHLPVTTALGLDNEPGWLAGYGWISAPHCRQWLPSAELRQVCVRADGPDAGTVIDLADRAVRPQPTPAGARHALLDMIRDPGPVTDKTWRTEPRHDPSPALTEFLDLRDRYCDGPTGTRIPAQRCDTDHQQPYPSGPTAAWNLRSRAARTHQLKHRGWTPLPTPTGTLWFSPAGQTVHVDRYAEPPPGLDPHAELPDPDQLHQLETQLTRAPGPHDDPSWTEPPPF